MLKQIAPLAMDAAGLDHKDVEARMLFDRFYKAELSRVQSKLKQFFLDSFVDALLTLFKMPSIIQAGSPKPPNMGTHEACLPRLKAPPSGFTPTQEEGRYQYSNSWHAMVNGENEFLNFETPECAVVCIGSC